MYANQFHFIDFFSGNESNNEHLNENIACNDHQATACVLDFLVNPREIALKSQLVI